MGVVNLQLDYVNLFINGNYSGPCIVEEFFKESILNRLNLPLGPIFKFDYSSCWTAFNRRNLESKLVRKKHEVFDINKLGALFAVNTLFFNQHPAYNTNIRFYYNPSSEKIEPIGYDIERIHEVD